MTTQSIYEYGEEVYTLFNDKIVKAKISGITVHLRTVYKAKQYSECIKEEQYWLNIEGFSAFRRPEEIAKTKEELKQKL